MINVTSLSGLGMGKVTKRDEKGASAKLASVKNTLQKTRLQEGTSKRSLGRLNANIRKESGEGLGLSTKAVTAVEKDEKEEAEKRVQARLLGGLRFLLHRAGHILFGSPMRTNAPALLLAAMYADGYTPYNSLRSRNARVRVSLALANLATGSAVPGITVVDLKKADYHMYVTWRQGEEVAKIQQSKVTLHDGTAYSVQLRWLTGDHLDRWCQMTGCGGRGHRCCICPDRDTQWSLNIHNHGHHNLGEMKSRGFPSTLAEEAPWARFVSPALHDLKGITLRVIRAADTATQAAVNSLCADRNFDISKNATFAQIREIVALLSIGKEDKYACTYEFRVIFVCLDTLIRFRYADVPWRFWGQKDQAVLPFFVLSRVAGHLLLVLMERQRAGLTCNAYCHSLNHWWSPHDALAFSQNDEFEEAENGRRKRDVPKMSSPQTYEVIGAMSEAANYPRKLANTVLRGNAVPQCGFLGRQGVILCHCLNDTHRRKLAMHRLCRQLLQIAGGAITIKRGPYCTLFEFPDGTAGSARICVCGRAASKTRKEWPVWEDKGFDKLERLAQQEWETCGEPHSTDSDSSESSDSSKSSDSSEASISNKHLTCPLCECVMGSTRSFTEIGLAAHLDSVHRDKVKCECRLRCPHARCSDIVFANGLSQHMAAKHKSYFNTKFRCPLCFEKLTKSTYFEHVKCHTRTDNRSMLD